ncbi:hypothetical protein, variant [Aphanomyces invadans]|uniref:Uncharacterized protein n=1 Tax=Aphanomyces invadans TaxID=157072 RepID=A0A024UGH1_9STRA|nr:hypothetical protein, variant [Aphanomyces invadans]ETW05506.1 hypothetical protein, variant [Aphanomyces invadans]|eukprot:XP_008865283.1 hypothetical protein, variant [Aphanomyces invadans]
MPLGILRFGVDGGATSSMVRRFTIVDHLTSTATDSPSSCEEDVAPLGLSDFLKEIEYPTISGSEQRPTTTSFAPAAAPAATGNSVGDDVVPSVGLPCSDEDDVMDPDELYRRILLQHPDLTAPLLTGVPVANAEATPCHPDVSDQALDAIETSDEPVILVSSPRPRLGPRSQHLGTTCTPAAAPDKPVKERHRHELDPALADILRRHNELQRKRTAIMTHPTIQKQLKSFWSMCVKPTVAEGCATAPGLARDGYHQFYATLLGGNALPWCDDASSSINRTYHRLGRGAGSIHPPPRVGIRPARHGTDGRELFLCIALLFRRALGDGHNFDRVPTRPEAPSRDPPSTCYDHRATTQLPRIPWRRLPTLHTRHGSTAWCPNEFVAVPSKAATPSRTKGPPSVVGQVHGL